MSPEVAHAERIQDLLTRLDEAVGRFTARLERAGDRATQATNGWSPAQIGAHVALVNENFTAVIDGSHPVASAPPEGFVERPWTAIAAGVPERFEAPKRFTPPHRISGIEAVARVRESAARLATAIRSLSPDRARHCFSNPIVGTISLYQAGEWAIAHVIRHNQQAKRILGE